MASTAQTTVQHNPTTDEILTRFNWRRMKLLPVVTGDSPNSPYKCTVSRISTAENQEEIFQQEFQISTCGRVVTQASIAVISKHIVSLFDELESIALQRIPYFLPH